MPVSARFKFKNHPDVKSLLDDYGNRATQSLTRQLLLEGEGIMAQAKELVPVDTGALRASGHVVGPIRRGVQITFELVFGGPAVKYAVKVHEDLAAFHKTGIAKYLEVPFNAAKHGMMERIARGMKKDLGTK